MVAVLKQKGEIRFMQSTDLQAVLKIEKRSYDYPWSGGIFSDCLNVGYCCLVYEIGGEVAGYGVMSAAAGESHILNICVAAEQQQRGIGRALLERLLEMAVTLGAEKSILEVRPSNEIAFHLYLSMGYKKIGIRKNYYPGKERREDALVLCKTLT